MKEFPNILVCPLDWGIGHATRCVPVIRELIRQNANVIIAANGRSLAFLKLEFPELQFVSLPGYKFSYPNKGSMTLKMLIQAPQFYTVFAKKDSYLTGSLEIIILHGVISDNRYGLSSAYCPAFLLPTS